MHLGMRQHIKYDTVVIGGGPVGMYATYSLAMVGLTTCIIDIEQHLGGQCIKLYLEKPIFDIPGFPKIIA